MKRTPQDYSVGDLQPLLAAWGVTPQEITTLPAPYADGPEQYRDGAAVNAWFSLRHASKRSAVDAKTAELALQSAALTSAVAVKRRYDAETAPLAEDLTLRNVELYFCKPYGRSFAELAGFPPPSYTAKDGERCWKAADLVPWLTGFFRGIAHGVEAFHAAARCEAELRPGASADEHRERALDRFVQVAVAKVLMKRLPP